MSVWSLFPFCLLCMMSAFYVFAEKHFSSFFFCYFCWRATRTYFLYVFLINFFTDNIELPECQESLLINLTVLSQSLSVFSVYKVFGARKKVRSKRWQVHVGGKNSAVRRFIFNPHNFTAAQCLTNCWTSFFKETMYTGTTLRANNSNMKYILKV